MMKKINEKLTDPHLLLWFIMVFIGFTTPIVKDVMLSITLDKNMEALNIVDINNLTILFSYLKAIALEFLIVVLLANGFHKTSIFFAFITGVVSFYFYNEFKISLDNANKHVIELIYSFIFPFVTALCSHVYISNKDKEVIKHEKIIEDLNDQLNEVLEKKESLIKQVLHLGEVNNANMIKFNAVMNELKQQNDVITNLQEFEAQQREKNKSLQEELKQASVKNKVILSEKESYKALSEEYRINHEAYIEMTTCCYCGEKNIDPKGIGTHKTYCEKNPNRKTRRCKKQGKEQSELPSHSMQLKLGNP